MQTTQSETTGSFAVVGASADHFRKLGLDPHRVAVWEDGLRTSAAEGSFEWWYFDCLLDDGSKLTLEFYTKPPHVSPRRPLTPFVSLSIERPQGVRIRRTATLSAGDFAAAKDRCDVRIGKNTCQGDLRRYDIHVEIDDICVDASMTTQVPAWRPATGHVFFGAQEAEYVAWLPAVPRGSVSARLSMGGRSERLIGVGYHDHNWGNTALRKLVDHWYWGRAQVNDYTVVALMFCSHANYGKRSGATFMVAKGREIIASSVDSDGFSAEDPDVIEATGAPVHNRVHFAFEHTSSAYRVTFARQSDFLTLDFGDAGAYHRFLGEVTIERREGRGGVEAERAEAFWELLYFGQRARVASLTP